jgi:hypothetical protein
MGTFTCRSTFLYEFYIRTYRSVHFTFRMVSLLSPFNLRSLKVLSYEINIFIKVHKISTLCLVKSHKLRPYRYDHNYTVRVYKYINKKNFFMR